MPPKYHTMQVHGILTHYKNCVVVVELPYATASEAHWYIYDDGRVIEHSPSAGYYIEHEIRETELAKNLAYQTSMRVLDWMPLDDDTPAPATKACTCSIIDLLARGCQEGHI